MLNIQNTQSTTESRELLEMAAEAVIDAHRFGSPRRSLADRILSRYEHVPAMLPTTEEMTEQGADIVVIANALQSGLNVKAFGQAIEDGLNLRTFCDALKHGFKARGFAGLVRRNDIETVNEGLEHFVEYHIDNPEPRSILDRIAAMYGEDVVAVATC